jgi:transposase InsO family protein
MAAPRGIDYNEIHPHSTLGYLTPREFAARFQTTEPSQLSVA